MKLFRVVGIPVLLIVGADRRVLWAQAPTQPPAVAPALDSVARQIVAAARYATFATVDRSGQPQVRTVQPVSPDSAWSVWFATNPRTRKVQEVSLRPQVAMHYYDPVTESYVALTGRARVVRDRATKDAHWNPAWSAFYRDRDSSVVLIQVITTRVEVVSPHFGVQSDPRTWRPQSFVPTRR